MANKNKTIIIFGCTGTVGRCLIDCLTKEPQSFIGIKDPKLVGVSNDDKGNKEIESKYKIHTMTKDATKAEDVMDVYNMHKDDGILGIVSVVGAFAMQRIQDLTPEQLMKIMNAELLPGFNILKGGAEVLAKQGGGSLVCCSASVVHHGMKAHEAFAAAKGANEAMHKCAAATYAPKNVRINCVAPGLIHKDTHGLDQEMLERSAKLYPLKRLAEPEEVASAICFLVHPRGATFTTGSVVYVDGGLAKVAPVGVTGEHAGAPHGQAQRA